MNESTTNPAFHMRGALAAVVCSLVLASCARSATTYSGTLQAEAPNVGSIVGGRVISVPVTTGNHVTKGQIILQFDPKNERAALAQAQGQLAQARATLADLEAGPRPEDIAKANADAEQARRAYEQARITGPHQITEAQATVKSAAAAATVASDNLTRARDL